MIKVGDKVQISTVLDFTSFGDDMEYAETFIGKQGVVVEIGKDDVFTIDVKFDNDKHLCFHEGELTKINDDHWGEGV